MRLLPLAFALIALSFGNLTVSAAAQSGTGGLSGLVLPAHAEHPGAPRAWGGVVPAVTLVPIATHQPTEAQTQRAADGRYAFGPVPMGLYRLRAEAPGFAPWEAEVYVPSDAEARVYVLLHPQE